MRAVDLHQNLTYKYCCRSADDLQGDGSVNKQERGEEAEYC